VDDVARKDAEGMLGTPNFRIHMHMDREAS
jgi:hypothetical protein